MKVSSILSSHQIVLGNQIFRFSNCQKLAIFSCFFFFFFSYSSCKHISFDFNEEFQIQDTICAKFDSDRTNNSVYREKNKKTLQNHCVLRFAEDQKWMHLFIKLLFVQKEKNKPTTIMARSKIGYFDGNIVV